MAFEYNLPLSGVTVQTVTYVHATSTTSTVTGTLNLSAVTTLTDTLSVGAGKGTKFILDVALAAASTGGSLTAANDGILLTIPSSRGSITTYGYVDSSTFTWANSAYTASIKFRDPNFIATTLNLSGVAANATFATTSRIDNPLVVLQGNPFPSNTFNTTVVYQGLSSSNVYFRTVSRQARLVQSEY